MTDLTDVRELRLRALLNKLNHMRMRPVRLGAEGLLPEYFLQRLPEKRIVLPEYYLLFPIKKKKRKKRRQFETMGEGWLQLLYPMNPYIFQFQNSVSRG